MRLTFLGTSSGVPTKERNVTGLAIRNGGEWDLFDCGEATQHRLLETSLSLHKLTNIFISHLHGDHVFGLFGLLASRSMNESEQPLAICGPVGLQAMVEAVLGPSATVLSFPVDFHELSDAGGAVLADDARTVEAIPLSHRVTSFAYRIREHPRPGEFDVDRARTLGVPEGPLFGQLQRGEAVTLENGDTVDPLEVVGPARSGRDYVIAGDNRDPAALLDRTAGTQLLVHEATFTEPALAKLGDDRGHSTAARVASAAEAAGVPNLILTHFSPRYGSNIDADTSIEDVRAEAAAHFSGSLHLAHDRAEYVLTPDGELRRGSDPS